MTNTHQIFNLSTCFLIASSSRGKGHRQESVGVHSSIADDCGEGNGNPLQRSCLENPTDRGAWSAIVHGSCLENPTDRGAWSAIVHGSCLENPMDRGAWSAIVHGSCLENSMDRGAWSAIVHGVSESQKRLSD